MELVQVLGRHLESTYKRKRFYFPPLTLRAQNLHFIIVERGVSTCYRVFVKIVFGLIVSIFYSIPVGIPFNTSTVQTEDCGSKTKRGRKERRKIWTKDLSWTLGVSVP